LRTPFPALWFRTSTAQNLSGDGVLLVQAVRNHPRERPESHI